MPEAKLLADWPHKAGDTVRVDEIFALAESISQAYREAGYALSFAMVPQQQIDGGVFRIQVVEGFVERVVIKGDLSEAVRADMQAFADRILASRPLRTADLERYLLLINDMPGGHGLRRPLPGCGRGGRGADAGGGARAGRRFGRLQ
ncbi:POTRA domain-containing protein [Sinorhizobium medicae]